MKQREAVYSAIAEFYDFVEGEPVSLTKEQRTNVIDSVTEGLANGTVDFSDEAKTKYNTSALIRVYVSGLVNNWLRKDPRLNGSQKYEPKNPGSRSNNADDQLKARRILRKQLVVSNETDKVAEVDAAIATRLSELKQAKKPTAKVEDVDLSSVPDDLKEMLGIVA